MAHQLTGSRVCLPYMGARGRNSPDRVSAGAAVGLMCCESETRSYGQVVPQPATTLRRSSMSVSPSRSVSDAHRPSEVLSSSRSLVSIEPSTFSLGMPQAGDLKRVSDAIAEGSEIQAMRALRPIGPICGRRATSTASAPRSNARWSVSSWAVCQRWRSTSFAGNPSASLRKGRNRIRLERVVVFQGEAYLFPDTSIRWRRSITT